MESSVIGGEKWGDVRLDEKLSEQAGGEAGERENEWKEAKGGGACLFWS